MFRVVWGGVITEGESRRSIDNETRWILRDFFRRQLLEKGRAPRKGFPRSIQTRRRTSSSVILVFTSVPAPWEQLCITPFMSRYRLSIIGTDPESQLWFSRGYRSLIQRKNFGTPILADGRGAGYGQLAYVSPIPGTC